MNEYLSLEGLCGEPQDGEAVDDLQCRGLTVLQDRATYCFSSDAALLANFATPLAGQVCELCAGSGVISLLLAKKTGAKRFVEVELQQQTALRAARSVVRNGLADRIGVWWGAVQDAPTYLGNGTMDAVVANPPYFRVGEGEMSDNPLVAMSRHETHLTLSELLVCAAKLLRYGGNFYVVYNAGRLAELLDGMRQNGIEPKRLITVQPAQGKYVDTVLVEGKRGGKNGMTVQSALRADLEARFTPAT